jgi:hypothetical protein
LATSRIACIAWGSLLWDPRTLPLAAPFAQDGPMLPIEFSRVALDGRVTLVVDALVPPVRTCTAPLAVDGLDDAVKALASREGVPAERIGDWIGVEMRADASKGAAGSSGQATPAVRGAIASWLARREYEAVLWTALPFRMPDGRFVRPDWTDLIDHLERLDGPPRARAEEYVRRAPAWLRTPNRLRFEAVFGWSPVEASAGAGAGPGAQGG